MLLLHEVLAHPKWVDLFIAKAHSTGAVLEDLHLEKLHDVLVASVGGDTVATTDLTAASTGHVLEGLYFAVADVAEMREMMWSGGNDDVPFPPQTTTVRRDATAFLCIARSPESLKTGLSRMDMVRAYSKPGRSAIVISAHDMHVDRARNPLRFHYLCRRAATVARSDLPPTIKLVDLTQWKRVLKVLDMDRTLRRAFLAKVVEYVLLVAAVPAPVAPVARTAVKRPAPSTPICRIVRPTKAMRMSPRNRGKQLQQLAKLLQTTIDGLHQMHAQMKLLTTTVLTTNVEPTTKPLRRRHSSCN
ncbi:hypothetical protein SPRG_22225 [Saprolegnia parasitica CBS 223.65]|uniref:Uncharacterized protein n=1 Tax=Saprolegnia parasitica (strain CBS 223.65) TaxID=695850 RepID=A0A067CFB2_SAPPC|nr:hypothetical protein SPRG_22225 [Saprolegnia parasitica CBS 223.65]KDO25512.1 hypothetical protein SPRG_22225 [Saprolegnia parasitica CBS 223.65]|eukprot:XP_012203792.1 hypothetical protein SPRG_22225 [Saprolegnia parasitica CBS 223.65]